MKKHPYILLFNWGPIVFTQKNSIFSAECFFTSTWHYFTLNPWSLMQFLWSKYIRPLKHIHKFSQSQILGIIDKTKSLMRTIIITILHNFRDPGHLPIWNSSHLLWLNRQVWTQLSLPPTCRGMASLKLRQWVDSQFFAIT
jgi:hypothetical protein